MIGQNQTAGIRINYYSSLLKLIEFIEVKSHIFVSEIANKRIFKIDNLLFDVKKNFEEQVRKIDS